eukprot:12133644-Alexandrium_andersonii.AAC.1
MEARLSHVDEESLSGPTPTTVNMAPAPGRQVGQKEPECLEGRSRRGHGVVLIARDVLGDITAPHVR